MKEKLPLVGAISAAVLASVCCIGPVVLAGLSVGAVAAAQKFAPWRPLFVALTTVFLAAGFYLAYRKPKASECAGEACEARSFARWGRPLLWMITILAAVLLAFPYYYGPLRAALERPVQPAVAAGPQAEVASVTLKLSGLTCEGCAATVRNRLLQSAGVTEADVSYSKSSATVKYDPAKTGPDRLIEVVRVAGYDAALQTSAGR